MDSIAEWLAAVKNVLDVPIFKLGNVSISLWMIAYIIGAVIALFYLSGKLRHWTANRILSRSKLELGIRQAIGSIVRYIVIVVGLLIILQTAGIDLTTLNILAGAVGIGVGFGLQNVANNFISGVIILFERPIKVGDRIEVGDVEGDVASISARSTTIITNDNIAIIVPNSKFISENVINWSYTDRKVRFKIPIGVAYGSNTRLVEKLLLEVAAENKDVLKDPAPAVRFTEFGDSSLNFELRAWTTSLLQRKGKLISDLNFAISDKFLLHNIEIPFPQRDLHIRSMPARFRIDEGGNR